GPGIGDRAPRHRPGPRARRHGDPDLRALRAAFRAHRRRRVCDRARGGDRARCGRRGRGHLVSLAKVMADSPFIRDVPAARALDAWRSARDAAGRPARLPAAVPPYQHVRSLGEDVTTAELLLPEGHRLRATDVAAAAAAGATRLRVRRRPVVTILPTGDEVRPIGADPGAGEIIDTNS